MSYVNTFFHVIEKLQNGKLQLYKLLNYWLLFSTSQTDSAKATRFDEVTRNDNQACYNIPETETRGVQITYISFKYI